MIGDGDRDLTAIDRALTDLFGDLRTPIGFTTQVLRRLENERWRRESHFQRVFYLWAYAAGALMIVATAMILDGVRLALS